PIFDTPAEGPSIWFGGAPQDTGRSREIATRIHNHLATLTMGEAGADWRSRGRGMEGLRRTLLREAGLGRLPPTKTERHQKAWGQLLVEAFWKPVTERHKESMAHRTEAFLEDICGASGSFDERGSARATLLDATRLRDQRFVALVKGGNHKGR